MISRDELFRLYEVNADQYKYEVEKNWNHVRDILVLALALLAAGTGLLAAPIPLFARIIVLLIFVSVFVVSRLGLRSIDVGREYTRVTMFKVLFSAHALGITEQTPGASALATHAIATTSGMRRAEEALHDPDTWVSKGIGPGNLLYHARVTMTIVGWVGLFAALIVLYAVLGCPGTGLCG